MGKGHENYDDEVVVVKGEVSRRSMVIEAASGELKTANKKIILIDILKYEVGT